MDYFSHHKDGFGEDGLPLDETTPDEAERQFFEKADLDYESRADK